MFLSINPNFLSQTRDLAVSAFQSVLPDFSTAIHRILVFHGSISTITLQAPSVPSLPRIETSLALIVHEVLPLPPLPPLPPPPPPVALFTAADGFSSPTYISTQDEVGSYPIDLTLLWLACMAIGMIGIWTIHAHIKCEGIKKRIAAVPRELAEDVRRWIATVALILIWILSGLCLVAKEISIWSAPHCCSVVQATQQAFMWSVYASGRVLKVAAREISDQSVPYCRSASRATQHAFLWLAFAGSRGLKVVLCHILSTLLKAFQYAIPWAWEALLCLTVWTLSNGFRLVFASNTPAPIPQPEKSVDAPIPDPPPLPPPRASWIEIVLAGGQRSGLHPQDLVSLRFLGKGGFGTVIQGLNRTTGRTVAIKRISKRFLGEDGQRLLTEEIRAMNRLRTLSLFPTLLGSFVDDRDYILVMDYLSGGTMFEKIRSGELYTARPLALYYAGQLLLGLQCLHRLGIVHRDIKPDNLLFDTAGNLIISDFGLAKVFDTSAVGGPSWMMAKLWGGDSFPLLWPQPDNPHVANTPPSYGVDYWSFAVCFFEILTASLPYSFDRKLGGYPLPLTLDLNNSPLRGVLLSSEERSFFYDTLAPNPYYRLSVAQIKSHPIWQGLDWVALSRGILPIPSRGRVGGIRFA
ncbi:Non-specific serine/threonine protein kinase [Mycena venus]|uniref:Non-specific serine/threonine protein kinase n=1 Tax=Mycena venus TaxID=2733690 RepID=A0A8H7CRB8_9AGAR|nr:Non-specific serine/threonine protein kinase [Mycena venus]